MMSARVAVSSFCCLQASNPLAISDGSSIWETYLRQQAAWLDLGVKGQLVATCCLLLSAEDREARGSAPGPTSDMWDDDGSSSEIVLFEARRGADATVQLFRAVHFFVVGLAPLLG